MNQLKQLEGLRKFEYQNDIGNREVYNLFANQFKIELHIEGDLIEYLKNNTKLFDLFLDEYQDALNLAIYRMKDDIEFSYRSAKGLALRDRRDRRSFINIKELEEVHIANLKDIDDLFSKLRVARYEA